MSDAAEKLMSLDEFLTWEREQPERYEYARSVITMMTGGSLDRSTIASNLWTALRDRLRGSACQAFRGDTKVIANRSARYPDLSVTCTAVRGNSDVVPEPIVVVEVMSPSTEREDRGRKKFDYFATPSIQQYAIVEQDERLVDLYTRAGTGWTNEIVEGQAILRLTATGVEVSLDAIYDNTELDLTRARAATS
ncbi:MAG TPA: Uma2 family endonuclease [Stellaceae bacterium]|jgi:Uma2 family endonuclease